MDAKGLSFENPLFQAANGVPSAVVNPFGFQNAAASSGSDALRDDLATVAMMGNLGVQLARQNRFTMPKMEEPSLAYSKSRNKLYIQGVTIDADDAQGILEAQGLLGGPPTGLPTDGDWIPISRRTFGQLVDSIKNPSLSDLAARNFGRGVDAAQMLAGRFLQLAGAEELGQRIVDQQIEDLRKTAPYERQFTDIQSGDDAVDWFVANAAQQGPNLIESIATAGLGFLAGTAATGTPFGGAAAAFSSLLGKAAWKEAVKAAVAKKAKGEALNAAEQKLLREATGIAGAVAASYGQNLAVGAADIYNELREQGADADDVDARLKALSGAVPYAMLETLPEFLLAARVFKGVGARLPMGVGTKPLAKAGELLKRGATGLVVGGIAEGSTELGQEALLLSLSDQDFNAPENVNRLINSFAAGFGIGGPIGAVANLRSKHPTNLLNPAQSPEPTTGGALPTSTPTGLLPGPTTGEGLPAPVRALPGPTTSTAVEPYYTPVTLDESVATDNQPQLGNLNIQALPTPVPPVVPMGGPQIMVTPNGVAYQDQMLRQYGDVPPGAAPGSQGVLNVFGGQIPASELAARMQPSTVLPRLPEDIPTVAVNPNQGVLQFDSPAPVVTAPSNVQTTGQPQPQLQPQPQPQFQAPVQQVQNPSASQLASGPLPMRQVGPAKPVQLPLFTRSQAPRPSRAEILRRGVKVETPVVPVEPQQPAAKPPVQLSLFTKEGNPTIAALRSAGVKTKLPPVEPKTPKVRPTGKRGLKKQAGVAAIEIVPKVPNATQKGKLKKGRVAEHTQDNEGIRPGGDVGQQPTTEIQKGSVKASDSSQPGGSRESKAQTLKRGKASKAANVEKVRAKVVVEALPPDEAWEDMKPEGAPTYDRLPAATREQWFRDVANGKATMQRAEQLLDEADIELTPAEMLADAIAEAEIATSSNVFKDAIEPIINYAFFTPEDTNNKPLVDRARAFLNDTQFSDKQAAIMDEVYLNAVRSKTQLEAVYKGGSNKGKYKPWFSYAVARGLLPSIKTKIINLPAEFKTQPNPVTQEPTPAATQKSSAERVAQTPEAMLGELIDDLVAHVREYSKPNQPVKFKGKSYSGLEALAKELYSKVSKQGKNYIVRGHKLREYFKSDGTPKIIKSNGRLLITTTELTQAEQRALEQEQRVISKELEEAERLRRQIERDGFEVEDNWDNEYLGYYDGKYYRDDGAEAKSAPPVGWVRLVTTSFLNKLRVKPKVHIYDNVADLKQRNPDLYRRAAAARKEGDFDATKAAGYSFGSDIIIFRNFVRSEQQLKFILAHEVLGHFGLRSVIPSGQLNKVLNRVYNSDPDVQAAVDAMVTNHGMSKLEAIEEYLADNAADLDVSIIARVWNVLKNFLNKLGFKFQDDEARYFINLARKHVRRGNTGNFVNARTVVSHLESIARDQVSGRYARVYAGDMGSRLISAGALNRRFGNTGGIYGAIEAFAKGIFGTKADVPNTVGRILEKVQTLDNKARRSYGLNQIYRILERQQQYARSLLSKYQRMTSFTHSVDLGFLKKGVTEAEKERAGELLARAALLRASQATDELIKSFDSLVVVDDMGNVIVDPKVRAEVERAGFVTAEEFRKGFDITYSDGSTVRFQYDVDENSPEWEVYNELRNAVNEAAIDLMLSNYKASQAEANRVLSELNLKRHGANAFTADDLAAIRKAAAMYQAKRYAGSSVANAGVEVRKQAAKDSEDFVIAFGRALFNDDVFAAWVKDPNAKPEIVKDMEEYLKSEYDEIRAQLPSLRSKIKNDRQSFQVQKVIRDLFLFDLQSKNADYYAKRTILSSYVPFMRRGLEQVKLVAVDARGNYVALDENIRSALPYFQFNTRHEAIAVAEELDKVFGGDNEFVLLDEHGNEVTVYLKAEVSRTRQSPDLTEAVNFNEFVYVLNRLNVNITPDVRERIITTLTNQNARARRNLQRSGTEGWDKDVVRSVSEYLETSAHVAAKKLYRHRLDDILMNNAYWLGDDQLLRQLKDAVDNAQTDGERARAQRAYDEYAYMYRYMKGAAGANTVVIDGKEVPTLGRGEDYREEAKRILRWYSETTDIIDSTERLLSGEFGSSLKLLTVLMQLGGSIATAAVNLTSLVTHALPYLSYYNSARGFGGGYGEAKAATALWQAARDVKHPSLADAAALAQMLRDGTYARYGLTEDEAIFLFNQTEQGTLQAAQFNALVGTARGKLFNNKARAAVQAWMSLFSYTEQFNRRVTALAAYRLEKERLLAQGVANEQELIDTATEAARTAVYASQGEYAMFNRPEMARGNVLQYVFMYKQFVIVTVQLLRALPPKGQLLMLGLLLLTSGVKGLPFAEDIFDIVDTIAQKLGLKMASVEKELAEWIDDVAPGMTPYAMRGVLNRMTGATISTRLGMGDLVPLTGAFKAGADPAREALDFAGPVFSGIAGLVGMAGNITKYGAEAIGLRDDVTTLSEIMQNSPVAAFRAIADGLVYYQNGMITNNRGQVVSREAPFHVIAARMMGFYPAIATEQNDIVRLSKNVANYAKAIKAEYVSAYVKAKLAGDTKRMREIEADVNEWNRDAKGTGLEINMFLQSANRAAREAARPTVARYLKSAPLRVRPETERLLRMNGLEELAH